MSRVTTGRSRKSPEQARTLHSRHNRNRHRPNRRRRILRRPSPRLRRRRHRRRPCRHRRRLLLPLLRRQTSRPRRMRCRTINSRRKAKPRIYRTARNPRASRVLHRRSGREHANLRRGLDQSLHSRGEGGAETGDALISMADIAFSAPCISSNPTRVSANSRLILEEFSGGNQACPSQMRCGLNWRST